MRFNSEKFELIRYGRDNTLQTRRYNADGQEIVEKDKLRDLGIQLNSQLTDDDEHQNITKTANKLTTSFTPSTDNQSLSCH